mmetsp:Transcript_26531/g.61728  ORF Transcript_26531/g.61728 Transcript_26531/m.61728 type:complete len:210 (-) Transcript_26531:1948-2577(-)
MWMLRVSYGWFSSAVYPWEALQHRDNDCSVFSFILGRDLRRVPGPFEHRAGRGAHACFCPLCLRVGRTDIDGRVLPLRLLLLDGSVGNSLHAAGHFVHAWVRRYASRGGHRRCRPRQRHCGPRRPCSEARGARWASESSSEVAEDVAGDVSTAGCLKSANRAGYLQPAQHRAFNTGGLPHDLRGGSASPLPDLAVSRSRRLDGRLGAAA